MNAPTVDPRLIPVQVGNGLVVMHTREEYRRLWQGVDRQAAKAARGDLETDEPERAA